MKNNVRDDDAREVDLRAITRRVTQRKKESRFPRDPRVSHLCVALVPRVSGLMKRKCDYYSREDASPFRRGGSRIFILVGEDRKGRTT